MDRLYGDYEYMFENLGWTRGKDFVQKYLRTRHVIVFKMSHDVPQVAPYFISPSCPTSSHRALGSTRDAYQQRLQVDTVHVK